MGMGYEGSGPAIRTLVSSGLVIRPPCPFNGTLAGVPRQERPGGDDHGSRGTAQGDQGGGRGCGERRPLSPGSGQTGARGLCDRAHGAVAVHDEAQMPFGGVKGSGIGRFGGKAGIAEFTDLRWITVQTTPRHYPF